MKIKPEWLEWAKHLLHTMKHNGLINMPVRELCYRVDKEQNKLFLVYEGANYDRVYKAINEEVFKAVGFPVVDGERLSETDMLAELNDPQRETAVDRPALIKGMLEREQRGRKPR
jgi:hypothetical protein